MIRYRVCLPIVVCLWFLSSTDQPGPQNPKPSTSPASKAAADTCAADADAVATTKRAKPNGTTPPARAVTAHQAEAIREIMRIRKLQGDIFAGTMFGNNREESDQQFAEILQNVIRTTSPTPPTAPQIPASQVALPADQATLQFNQFVPQPARHDGTTRSSADLTETLRATADVLDQQASLLERASRYRDADRLRRLAHTIRREARRWADDRN